MDSLSFVRVHIFLSLGCMSYHFVLYTNYVFSDFFLFLTFLSSTVEIFFNIDVTFDSIEINLEVKQT